MNNNRPLSNTTIAIHCGLLVFFAVSLGAQDPSLFDRPIATFKAANISRIDALLTLAREQQLPMGIEYTGPELYEAVSVSMGPTDLRGVVQRLFPDSKGFRAFDKAGVLVISHTSVPDSTSNILDLQVPRLSVPATTLQRASSLLWMTLAMQLNPDIKGFAGSIIGEQALRIPSMELTQLTFRDALGRLIKESGRAAWVIQVKPEMLDKKTQRGYNIVWMIAEYDSVKGSFGQMIRQQVNANSR